ncbi:MAG: BamA/TamA family outer membrane protein [Muribaculaceae bacterium]|nr:BamA/TamA family outer membrane protein [Muribaculaceae bacterium]
MKASSITSYIVSVLTVIALSACSTTSKIPADELLYTGLKGITYENSDSIKLPDDLKSEIRTAVNVAPNNYWKLVGWRYPFPLGLWVYNNWPNPPKGFRHWLYEKLVEEPVLVSDVRPELRTKMLEQMLDNNGYFRGTATYTLNKAKNPKKASVSYTVYPGEPYPVESMELLPDSSHLCHLIDSFAQNDSYLMSGMRYSTDSLSDARIRITNKVRNHGYYFFRPTYIEYLADTVRTPGKVAMKMTMDSKIPDFCLRRYKTGHITVCVQRANGGGTPDTLSFPNVTIVQMMPSRLRRKILPECIRFRPGRVFSVRDMDRTQSNLSRLGIFSGINIEALPDTSAPADDPRLDVLINCTFDKPLEVSLEANATSKSNSYIGPGLIFGITNKNIFGGGEQFSIKLNGSYEWQTGGGNKGGVFNSYEAGITTSLAIPRLIAPKFIPRSRFQLNWTRFQLNADLLNRPHYFRMAQFNMSMTYDWRVRRHVQNSFTPLKLTYTKLMNTTATFDSIMDANQAVALSFRSQFIPQMMYSFTYDKAIDRDNLINWQFSVQEAGNLFWGIYELCGVHGEKKLFGTPFSQFIKGTTQIVYNRRLTGDNWLVARVATGAAHAYANASQVPYAEQFYVGGANSIRAFTVRSIGPGSYRAPEGSPEDNFDQTGTFKFEANLEYRFPIFGPLHGALFLDTGNVWLLKDDPQRPGGKLQASSFLRDLALGTGVGLRFDIGMLVLRGDLGIGIHAPYDTGRHGYYNMTSFGKSLAFHLAIGYPF